MLFTTINKPEDNMRIVAVIFMIFCLVTAASAQQDTEAMAETLIQLRGEVEDIQSELQIQQAEHAQSMAYLNTREVELTANLDRELLQIKQAESDLANIQEKIKALGIDSKHMAPEVLTMIEHVSVVVDSGIPFKQQARKEVLLTIKRQLNSNKMTAQQAINQTWAFIEDELRLSKENGLYSQTINLDGHETLVEVAKLGTVLMYFRTKQNKYGHSFLDKNDEWSFKLLDSESEQQTVATLFDSLQKQIRQGYFELPLSSQMLGDQP